MSCVCVGKALSDFQEGRITFPPTYKLKPVAAGSAPPADSKPAVAVLGREYDETRVPSYTDRILFHSFRKNSAVCSSYGVVPEVMVSDHVPVFAIYEIEILPGRDRCARALPLPHGTPLTL